MIRRVVAGTEKREFTIQSPQGTFIDSVGNIILNSTYTYEFRHISENGKSQADSLSLEHNFAPPTDLIAEQISGNEIELTWTYIPNFTDVTAIEKFIIGRSFRAFWI